MEKRTLATTCGALTYWVNSVRKGGPCLVFLPGLTADHRLFDQQVAHFEPLCDCLVWDPPAHGESRPFTLEFVLDDWARWLHDLLQQEGIQQPVLVGQSMGGYVSQMFMQLYPGEAVGFVCIDSAPLQREYYQNWELAALKHTYGMYHAIPWKLLISWGAWGTATSDYGRALMRDMMLAYRKEEYCSLVAAGYAILARAVESERGFAIDCPARFVCGAKDQAGSTKRYNQRWAAKTGHAVIWIEGAGHNANTDEPEQVNQVIQGLLDELAACG